MILFPCSKEAMFFKQRSSDMDNSKSLVDRVKDGAKGVVAGIRDNTIKYASAVSDGAKKLAVYGVVGAVVLTAGVNVAEGAELTNGFYDLISNKNPPTISKTVRMEYGDNLMIRDVNGVANVVSKEGTKVSDLDWDGEIWRIGFAKYVEGGIQFGGYANNDNDNSNDYPGYEGWCFGSFYDSVFADGETADEVMIIHDQLGDGIGTLNGGQWTLGGDDKLYWSEDIEFNGKQGDLGELGTFNYIQTKILPPMTINDRPPRTGPAGIDELAALSENWLCSDCHPYDNNDCNGADWNYDGKVNFVDFSYMAQGWDPEYVSE